MWWTKRDAKWSLCPLKIISACFWKLQKQVEDVEKINRQILEAQLKEADVVPENP